MDERLNAVLKRVFDIEESDIKRNLPRDEIAKWDSLTHMDLVTSLEREFGIQIDTDEIIAMISLDSIRRIMQRKALEN